MSEPDDPTLALLRVMRDDIAGLRSELTAPETRLSEQLGKIIGFRRAVLENHTSALGHGVLIRQLDDRFPRIEQHLDLPPFPAP